MTLKELKKEIITKFEEFIYDPGIELLITSYRDIKVYVSGEVLSPGLYDLKFEEN